MKTVIALTVFCLNSSGYLPSVTTKQGYVISKIELNDNRIIKALSDYIKADDLTGVEGAVILKYDKDKSDIFYVGYMVYRLGLRNTPPSFYTFVDGKMVLIYTGLEAYLKYDDKSYKSINKDLKDVFSEGSVILESTYWVVSLLENEYQKKVIEALPY